MAKQENGAAEKENVRSSLPRRTTRKPAKKEGEELIEKGVDTMLCVDGKTRKLWCPGCGGPRDPELALRVPCVCCGSLGTVAKRPELTEDDLDIVVGERPAEQAIVEDYPTSDAAKAIKLVRSGQGRVVIEETKEGFVTRTPAPRPQPQQIDVQDLFLSARW